VLKQPSIIIEYTAATELSNEPMSIPIPISSTDITKNAERFQVSDDDFNFFVKERYCSASDDMTP
jgi:hypothetical protein